MMSQEDAFKMMLKAMLPLKFDTNIKIKFPDKEETEIHLIGDIFQSKLQGEDRIFIALKTPERDE